LFLKSFMLILDLRKRHDGRNRRDRLVKENEAWRAQLAPMANAIMEWESGPLEGTSRPDEAVRHHDSIIIYSFDGEF
jgi:hypothetical protein